MIVFVTLCNSMAVSNAQTLLPGVQTSSSTQLETTVPTESREAIRDMVARLSDQEVRELLLERLDAVADAAPGSGSEQSTDQLGVFGFIEFWANGVQNSAIIAVTRFPDLLTGQVRSVSNFVSERGGSGTLRIIGLFLLAIVLGLMVEVIVRRLTRKWHARIANPVTSVNFKESFQLLSLRCFLDVAGLIAFAFVAFAVLTYLPSADDEKLFDMILFELIVFPRLMLAFLRFLLAPARPELRLVHTDDWTATFVYKHAKWFFILMGLGSTLITFNGMNGYKPGELRLGFWTSAAVFIYFIYIAWHTREGQTRMLTGKQNDVTPMEAKVARIYPYAVIALTVLVWLVTELIVHLEQFNLLSHSPQMVSLLIFLFAPAMDTLIRGLVAYAVPPMQGEGIVAEKAYHSTKRSYLRIGRVIAFGLLIMVLINVWQIDLDSVASNAVGANVAAHFIQLLIILSVGYLIWEVVSLLFNRKLAAEHTAAGLDLNSEEPGGGEGGGTGASRLSTILPLLRFTIQTIVVTMTVLIGLSNIGINVTPLLAGAGVVGIAVGFGAQKLVADVVSGIFFLIDDAFRAGEYISVDDTVGTIEKISLRSMQLRHHRGGIHTIPYGEIPKLTNYSRDWVLMKLKFTVPFDTDLKKVKKIFKQIGSEVIELPHFKDDFLQPFKSQGVLEVNDIGLVIGGKFMAKPGTQFMMRKELYQRIQNAFEANDIQFARKEVRVKLDGEHVESMDPAQMQSIGAAASDAIEEFQENISTDKR